MAEVIQIGDRTITAAEIIPLLTHYQLLPQLRNETLIDQAITTIVCTPEEAAQACQHFWAQHNITSKSELQVWLAQHHVNSEQFEALATRSLKIEKFKQMTWGPKLQSYFLKRKGQLDQVMYSIMHIQDFGLAQELYYRIQEGEQSFADLAREYSQGPEAATGGLMGPVELSRPPRILAEMLSVSRPGQLWPPLFLGKGFIILRLERHIPAQLDKQMSQRLLNELFTAWLQEQAHNLNAA